MLSHVCNSPSFLHEEYSVVSGDGLSVPVQRFIPPNAKAPAVLYVHGGPGTPINPDDATMLHLLGEGYEFVCAAYRGSAGYGPRHRGANRGEYGRADVWDVLACAQDWKERTDGSRPLILAGYSYGGFLGLLALSRAKDLLAGGIIMWPVTGLHRFPSHAHRAFPEEREDRYQALTERSPVERASHIRVPVQIFHGALDSAGNIEELSVIQQRIQTAGGDCTLKLFDDDTHALRRHLDEIHADILRFLGRFEQG
ncbi:MAG: alpha/beta fold hydrolase [Caldilineaceae bacterium SB0664_bin_22]|nr:alpha/beta fold hydrolase [Caldilineaceae bacterium SB0664_bin_22]